MTGLPAFPCQTGGSGMRSELSAPLSLTGQGRGLHAFARRQIWRAAGLALFGFVAFALAALGTWNVADPSFSHATANPVTNAMGYAGAVFADLAMQFFGLAAVAALVPAVAWGLLLLSARGIDRMGRRAAAWLAAALFLAAIAGCLAPPPSWPLPSGLGGVLGDVMLGIPALFIGGYPTGIVAGAVAFYTYICGAGGLRGIVGAAAEDDELVAETTVDESGTVAVKFDRAFEHDVAEGGVVSGDADFAFDDGPAVGVGAVVSGLADQSEAITNDGEVLWEATGGEQDADVIVLNHLGKVVGWLRRGAAGDRQGQ